MARTFGQFKGLPTGETELKEAGWHKSNSVCDPKLGFAWTQDKDGATATQPMKLYTTLGGQPAGVGMIILGHGASNTPLPGALWKWATEFPIVGPEPTSQLVHIDVAFRSGPIMCSGKKDESEEHKIGDVLIVNPKAQDKQNTQKEWENTKYLWKALPLEAEAAQNSGWTPGSCFDTMGTHWGLDTSMGTGRKSVPPNKLSWKADQLFPVVTMYGIDDKINAIFFASTLNQVTGAPPGNNQWEPRPLSSEDMCKNFCDDDCAWTGMDTEKGPWSTAHIFFKATPGNALAQCPKDLACEQLGPFRVACCPVTNADTVV